MRGLLTICLFLILGLCFAENVAFFPGRSGDMILSKKGMEQDDSVVYLLENKDITGQFGESNQMEETSMGDMVSMLIGSSSILNSKANRKSFPSGNIFNKAKANLLMVVNGIGKSQLEHFPKVNSQKGKEMNLIRNSFPQDSISTLASIATGASPSVHGIVNAEWFSAQGPVSAYRSQALPLSSSFVDLLSLSSSGSSLSLSSSFDFQMASAFAAHQSLSSQHPHFNNFAFSFQQESGSFESLYEGKEEMKGMSHSEILKRIATKEYGTKSTFDVKSLILSVWGKDERATFNLNTKENFYFFAEMEMIESLLHQLEAEKELNQLVLDQFPDLFNFCFSTLKGMEEKHGKNSAQLAIAIQLLDNFLVRIIDQLNALYDNQLTVQLVFLSGENAVQLLRENEAEQETAFAVVEGQLNRNIFTKYYPHIFLYNKKSLSAPLCHQMEKETGLQVSCPALQSLSFLSSAAESNDTHIIYDSSAAELFHVLLWFSVILGIALFFAVYAIFSMDVGADSLLFRSTTPNNSRR